MPTFTLTEELSLATLTFVVLKLVRIGMLPKIRQRCPWVSHFGFPCTRLVSENHRSSVRGQFNIFYSTYDLSELIPVRDSLASTCVMTCCDVQTWSTSECNLIFNL